MTPTAPQEGFSAGKHPPLRWKAHRKHHKATQAAPAPSATNDCSVFYAPTDCSKNNICTPFNQGQVGSCTGNAGVKSITLPPVNGNCKGHACTETDAVAAYSAATKRDNGCSCTASSCSGSYPPNDQGSSGDSVYTCMQQSGLIQGFTPADTYADLLVGMRTRACIVGMPWYNSQFTVLPTGQIKVTTSSGLAGGHELVAIGHDSINARFWVLNSWGYWGVCIASQVNSQTQVDGTGCGYAWITDADMLKLFNLGAEGDCMTVPARSDSEMQWSWQTLSEPSNNNVRLAVAS